MPLHLQSIINDDQNPKYLTDLLMMVNGTPDEIFVSKDRYIMLRFVLKDEMTGNPFGKLVFTMKDDNEQNAVMILDLDITLDNDNRTALRFLDLRNGSSDSNEYYNAKTEEDDVHLELETVCRHTLSGPLVDSIRDVSISAFPFQLTVYKNIEDFNKWAGFGKGQKVANMEFTVHGFSERFMMPGGALGGKKEDDESYSFFLGKVLSWQDVRWMLGENALDFVIVWLDTALGIIPAAMGRDVFELSQLEEGAIIAMDADVKADLSMPGVFSVIDSAEE